MTHKLYYKQVSYRLHYKQVSYRLQVSYNNWHVVYIIMILSSKLFTSSLQLFIPTQYWIIINVAYFRKSIKLFLIYNHYDRGKIWYLSSTIQCEYRWVNSQQLIYCYVRGDNDVIRHSQLVKLLLCDFSTYIPDGIF